MFTWSLVGASSVAESTVLPAILRQPATVVASVVSRSPARAAQLIKAAGAGARPATLDQALNDPRVDAVYISSVNRDHHPQAMAAIAAGKHVFCEKPIALRSQDAAEMVEAAQRAG